MSAPVEYAPLTPVDVERHLTRLREEMPKAVIKLREARRSEARAKRAYDDQRRRAILSPECPKPSRDGHTVAYRDAWVEEQCAEIKWLYDVAKVSRETAEDHVRGLRDESTIVMVLGKSVNLAYQMAGSDR